MARYSSPASRAASAIASMLSRPSVAVVCACRSPRRSRRSISAGSAPSFGGLELTVGLAQLGRDPRQAERGIDALLRLTGDAPVVTHTEEAVLVQLESEPECAVAEGDVVRLGAGEVLHRRAAARGRHEPEIRLLAASQQHARLGLAPAEHALDEAVGREPVHDGGRARRSRARRDRRTFRSPAGGSRPG